MHERGGRRAHHIGEVSDREAAWARCSTTTGSAGASAGLDWRVETAGARPSEQPEQPDGAVVEQRVGVHRQLEGSDAGGQAQSAAALLLHRERVSSVVKLGLWRNFNSENPFQTRIKTKTVAGAGACKPS